MTCDSVSIKILIENAFIHAFLFLFSDWAHTLVLLICNIQAQYRRAYLYIYEIGPVYGGWYAARMPCMKMNDNYYFEH